MTAVSQSSKIREVVPPPTVQRKSVKLTDTGWFMFVLQLGIVLAFLIIWEVFSTTGLATRADMPGPIETFGTLAGLVITGSYWSAIFSTLGSWGMALLVAIVVGVPLGLFLGRNTFAFESSKGTIDFLRTIPAIALVPLALLVLGQSKSMVVLVATIPAVWPLLVQSIAAGQQSDPILHRVARSYRLTTRDRILYVLAPEAMAFIWPGLRLATTTSLLAAVFAELLGGRNGIGVELIDAQIYNQSAALYAWVLTACFLGLAINAVLTAIQKRLLSWHPALRRRDS